MAGFKELGRLTDLPEAKLQDVFDAIYHLSRAGKKVRIRNFGTFWCRHRKSRTINSPCLKGGGVGKVKESLILWFKPSPAVIEEVKARGKARKVKK